MTGKIYRGGLCAATFMLLLSGNSVQAESRTGLTISPAISRAIIGQNEAEKSLEFNITNNTKTYIRLKITTLDFGALDETGGLFLIGQPNDFQKKYGLANWLSLATPYVELAPSQSSSIKVSIINKDSLSPGGHYGAITFNSEASDSNGNSQINLKPVLTGLIFATKEGGAKPHLALNTFDHPRDWAHLPKNINLRFQNFGNIHLTPRGLVMITDPIGRVVSGGIINQNSGIILPSTFRRYSTPLNSSQIAYVPGKYKLTIRYRYDGEDNFRIIETTFNNANLPLAGASVIVITGVILLIAWGLRWVSQRKH